MSQFLGPIHHVMYGKIRLVHGWEGACVAGAEAAWGAPRVTELLASIGNRRWQPADGELAELIGDQPIHGWLQSTLNRAETSLAGVVAALRRHGDGADEVLRRASFDHGRATAGDATLPPAAGRSSLEAVAALLAGCYLDGMPCDQVSEVAEMTGKRLAVRRLLEIHRANWEAGGADVGTMTALQGAWCAGLAAGVSEAIQHHREVQPIAGMHACVDTFNL
jgi:hypothetical protein